MTETARDIKMNLRLWSDTQDLSELVRELGRPARRRYRKGEAVQIGRTQRLRTPKRHYVSYPDAEVHDLCEVAPWLESELDLLERSRLTASLTRIGAVEALLWIAIFANTRIEAPRLSHDIVERARSLGIKIFVENYSSDPAQSELSGPDNDADVSCVIPTKSWYPAD